MYLAMIALGTGGKIYLAMIILSTFLMFAFDVHAQNRKTRRNICSLKQRAAQGNAAAQYNLGVMYVKGEGVPQDYKESLKWYRLAAEQGLAKAQYNLGVMYVKGEGVPKDYKEAVKWYRLSAEQGYAEAQNSLGVMYRDGQGVPKDYAIAYAWLNLATANCEPEKQKKYSEVRGGLIKLMTPSQIAEGKRLTREWFDKYKKK